MSNDPILAVAIHAARRAAAVLVDAARDLKRRPAHAKDHADIVSNADAEAENAMIATLRAAFPEHAIVGKEAGEIVSQIAGGSRAGKNTLKWIVDPLDGTVNFRHGFPYYSVSIALTHGNEVTHARGARSGPRRSLHGHQGQGRAAERHADPDLDLRAPARTRWSAPCFRRAAAPAWPPTCRC